jgi:hypothetical protein
MSAAALAFSTPSLSERVFSLLRKVEYRLATTDAEKEAIFRLRYEAYLREGALAPSFAKRLSDKYDDLDNSWTFGIYVEGELASSIRICVASQEFPQIPALAVFPDILEPELNAGKIMVDPTRFVADHRLSRLYPELPYVGVRLAWISGEYFRPDIAIATVRTEHQAFYKRVFGKQVAAPARPYPTLIKPLSLLTLDYFANKDKVNRRYPFFLSTEAERRALFEMPGVAAREWGAPWPTVPMPAEPAFALAG